MAHKVVMQALSDTEVMTPLWDWPVSWALDVLRERRRRGLTVDFEPIGDPEYA